MYKFGSQKMEYETKNMEFMLNPRVDGFCLLKGWPLYEQWGRRSERTHFLSIQTERKIAFIPPSRMRGMSTLPLAFLFARSNAGEKNRWVVSSCVSRTMVEKQPAGLARQAGPVPRRLVRTRPQTCRPASPGSFCQSAAPDTNSLMTRPMDKNSSRVGGFLI
jgi:hypothetical protein